MAKKARNIVTEYRSYYLPMHFPVLLLSGDYWKISDIPSGRLHFHNCLEIGVCHSDSGTMEFYGEPLTFHEGDVTIIPKNVPHTTYSTPGTESHWSYLYFDPEELFKGILPGAWKNIDLSVYAFRGYKHILSREEYPGVYYLMQNIIRELEEQRPSYQISAKGLILSLYIELYRIQSMETASDSSYTGGVLRVGWLRITRPSSPRPSILLRKITCSSFPLIFWRICAIGVQLTFAGSSMKSSAPPRWTFSTIRGS